MIGKRYLRPHEIAFVVIVSALILILVVIFSKHGEPWQLRFQEGSSNRIDIHIQHDGLGVRGVVLQTDSPVPLGFVAKVVRPGPSMDPPGGKLVFVDVSRLPGRVTMQMGAHTIDIMERGLVLDGRDISWRQAMERPINLAIINSEPEK